jgi:pyroglutamyl-peptidase
MLKMKQSITAVLVTGFEPFGGEKENPSALIARSLHGQLIGGCQVTGVVLPCVFGEAITVLKRALREVQPGLVICVGQAGGRAEITPERIAINLDDARIPDNAGRQPMDRPIVRRAPVAYWSTLPIKAIVAALRRRKIPATVSPTAGTYVCNHVFYGLMHALRRKPGIRGGFIHVPFLPEQASAGQPSLPLPRMTRAISISIEVALNTRRDAKTPGGQTH